MGLSHQLPLQTAKTEVETLQVYMRFCNSMFESLLHGSEKPMLNR
jgi:hypothetical protein